MDERSLEQILVDAIASVDSGVRLYITPTHIVMPPGTTPEQHAYALKVCERARRRLERSQRQG